MSSESGEGGLSNAASTITLDSSVWKLGGKVSGVLENVVTKKEMVKSFGVCCPTTTVEGVISGIWANTKIFVQRQCDSGQIVLEYSRSHSLFKSSSEEGSKKKEEIGRKTYLDSSGGAADVLRHHLDQVQHVIAASDGEQRSDSHQQTRLLLMAINGAH